MFQTYFFCHTVRLSSFSDRIARTARKNFFLIENVVFGIVPEIPFWKWNNLFHNKISILWPQILKKVFSKYLTVAVLGLFFLGKENDYDFG